MIDSKLPITMLPVRIETRFAGTQASPQLQVRLYPDDVHIDHHDPRLTRSEVAAGSRYWTSVRAGTAGDQAWAQLLKDVGPTRAIWARKALMPTNASGVPTFAEIAPVEGNVGVAAVARALPGSFIVRVRHVGGQTVVHGSAIPASLQVGISFGDAPPGTTPASPPADADATLVLDEGMRWMVDFDAAVAVGMAVTVDLPAQTDFVQDVVVVGIPADDAEADGAVRLAALVESHRLSDGAAFIRPGTPTNNLADSPSGYSIATVPPPGPDTAPEEGSVAAVLAAAWSIDPLALAPIDGATSRELDEARLMGRALFEATWGSYLRQHAQPGFDLNLMPQAFAHVTSFVRGGGPLPAIRFGRQPYSIAPVMARGAWAPLAEGAFQQWLSGFLPRIRPLWTSGIVDEPSGPDLFAFEPASTRVRLRTTNMSAAVDYMIALGDATAHGNAEVGRRALLAELGLTNVLPSVFTHLFPKTAANLWLPMAADGDTVFTILTPAPKDANSVLGLLLRNSALRIAANATNEFAGLGAGLTASQVARATSDVPIANNPNAVESVVLQIAGETVPELYAVTWPKAVERKEDSSPTAFLVYFRQTNKGNLYDQIGLFIGGELDSQPYPFNFDYADSGLFESLHYGGMPPPPGSGPQADRPGGPFFWPGAKGVPYQVAKSGATVVTVMPCGKFGTEYGVLSDTEQIGKILEEIQAFMFWRAGVSNPPADIGRTALAAFSSGNYLLAKWLASEKNRKGKFLLYSLKAVYFLDPPKPAIDGCISGALKWAATASDARIRFYSQYRMDAQKTLLGFGPRDNLPAAPYVLSVLDNKRTAAALPIATWTKTFKDLFGSEPSSPYDWSDIHHIIPGTMLTHALAQGDL